MGKIIPIIYDNLRKNVLIVNAMSGVIYLTTDKFLIEQNVSTFTTFLR